MKYDSSAVLQKVEMVVRDTSLNTNKKKLLVYQDRISCKAACNHCCSRPIMVTIAEASIIKNNLIKKKKWSEVKQRALALKELEYTDSLTWFKMNIKCPVLDPNTGLCLAYEVRPLTCSTHFVESPPDSCNPWGTESIDFRPLDMEDAFQKATSEIERICGKSYLSNPVIMHRALEISERTASMEGLAWDQVLSLIARDH